MSDADTFVWQEDFLDWQDELSSKDHLVVLQRACIDFGYKCQLSIEGGVIVDGDLNDPDFLATVHQRYLHMYAGDILDTLVEDGDIKPDHVDESGEIIYALVEN